MVFTTVSTELRGKLRQNVSRVELRGDLLSVVLTSDAFQRSHVTLNRTGCQRPLPVLHLHRVTERNTVSPPARRPFLSPVSTVIFSVIYCVK